MLEISGIRSFRYESVYFDSPDLLTYRSHVQGRRKRFKVRSRSYMDTGECMFELKLKNRVGTTVKSRIPTSSPSAPS